MRLPEWVKVGNKGIHNTKRMLRHYNVESVCEQAKCPNIGICFAKPTAAFMILGKTCTRNCTFCAVSSGIPESVDLEEPEKIAMAAKDLGLRYVVITSVTRDDLPDGGAEHFAKTVLAVKKHLPEAKVEVLTPDFNGNKDSIEIVLSSKPDVFNHNIETVPSLYAKVRPLADYKSSLGVLAYIKKKNKDILTKSGLMLGFGEKIPEVHEVLSDLRKAECDIITIGQYLRPSKAHLPVVEYIKPEIFESFRLKALSMGFKYVSSAPLVRSSMNAEEMYNI
ncbi:MAG: lipoyl synthase [Nitrospirae bacterium]|nr:lipoyl synthase [Nitrospirota bacterium]